MADAGCISPPPPAVRYSSAAWEISRIDLRRRRGYDPATAPRESLRRCPQIRHHDVRPRGSRAATAASSAARNGSPSARRQGEGQARGGGRRPLRPLRVRPLPGCAPVPSPRSRREALRDLTPGPHPKPCEGAVRRPASASSVCAICHAELEGGSATSSRGVRARCLLSARGDLGGPPRTRADYPVSTVSHACRYITGITTARARYRPARQPSVPRGCATEPVRPRRPFRRGGPRRRSSSALRASSTRSGGLARG